MKTVLTNCTVIDCTGSSPMKDMTVVIEGEKIAELKPGGWEQTTGEGKVRVFDLEGGYVLPGLWNCHGHLGDLVPDAKHLMEGESAIDCAIRGGRNAMDALRAGVTGIRVVGERDFIDVAWKRAFDAGVFAGPHLFVCGQPIAITGGHGYEMGLEADGPFEVRKAVRQQLKQGVDQIKLMITSALVTSADGVRMTEVELLPDEVRAATKVAHQKGKRVCAHCDAQSIKTAIRNGVDCIEHGYFLDDEAAEMMVENDVFYVPTLLCTQESALRESRTGDFENLDLGDAKPSLKGRVLVSEAEGEALEAANGHLEGYRRALEAGVKICCGGDTSPIAEYTLVEIEHLVRAGMGEMEALIAATWNSADLCGVGDRLGTVEAGKLADLIVVSANPLENISNIRQLKLVLKGGKLVETKESEGLANFWELFFFD
jgi:imidazolonepropionase-like amidohydrolase